MGLNHYGEVLQDMMGRESEADLYAKVVRCVETFPLIKEHLETTEARLALSAITARVHRVLYGHCKPLTSNDIGVVIALGFFTIYQRAILAPDGAELVNTVWEHCGRHFREVESLRDVDRHQLLLGWKETCRGRT